MWIFLCVFQVGQACKAELLIASLEKRESGVISRKGVSGHCWMNIWHHSQADLAHFHFIFLLFMTWPTFSVSLFVFLKNLLELSDERSSSLSQNPKYKSDVIKKRHTAFYQRDRFATWFNVLDKLNDWEFTLIIISLSILYFNQQLDTA